MTPTGPCLDNVGRLQGLVGFGCCAADCNEKTATMEIFQKPQTRILEAVENCALYALGTPGDGLCAGVSAVVLEVLKACAVCWR